MVSSQDVTAALTSVQHMKGARKLGGHCKGFRWVGGWGRSATIDPVESECWEEGVTRLYTKGSKVYIQKVRRSLLPTLQGFHQPMKAERKYNSVWANRYGR